MFATFLVIFSSAPGAAPPFEPERRALAYLTREVPRWAPEHRCYSCHNNGDAVRALATALRLGRSVKSESLADSLRWLARPAGWDRNGGEGPFSDKRLATLHFAAALAELDGAGLLKDRRALAQAARRVAALQERDGPWRVVPDGTVGSAVTHGNVLATRLATRTLRRAGERDFADALRKADAWLRKAPVETVLDAGALLLALGRADDPGARDRRRHCLDLIRKGEARRGGWGPYVHSAPEVFDTAVVLLALAGLEQTPEVAAWRRRGRAYLLSAQLDDGSFPETTRPSGGDSYAQRVSTTGWALLALLPAAPPRSK